MKKFFVLFISIFFSLALESCDIVITDDDSTIETDNTDNTDTTENIDDSGTVDETSDLETVIRNELVQIAENEVGVKEGVDQREYITEAPGNWCWAFVKWVWNQSTYGDLPTPYTTASGITQYDVGKLPDGWNPEPGDVFKTGTHYCLVKSISGNTINTIEGNIAEYDFSTGNWVSQVMELSKTMNEIDYFLSIDGYIEKNIKK